MRTSFADVPPRENGTTGSPKIHSARPVLSLIEECKARSDIECFPLSKRSYLQYMKCPCVDFFYNDFLWVDRVFKKKKEKSFRINDLEEYQFIFQWNNLSGGNVKVSFTGISSQIRNKLRYWAVGPARGSCYYQAALSSNDSKTRYFILVCMTLS